MTEIPSQSHAEEILTELVKIPVFQDQPREELLWFISVSEERRSAPGEIIMREGDAPNYMLVMLEGEMRARAEHGPADGPVFTITTGDVTGMLPFSRLKMISVTGRAVVPSHYLGFPVSQFIELFKRLPELVRRLVGLLTDRVRSRTEQPFGCRAPFRRRFARLFGPPAPSRSQYGDRPRRLWASG
jgi:CRP-like cAMP-binding protein